MQGSYSYLFILFNMMGGTNCNSTMVVDGMGMAAAIPHVYEMYTVESLIYHIKFDVWEVFVQSRTSDMFEDSNSVA